LQKTAPKSQVPFSHPFAKDQRWISELELNLGLGIVREIKDRRVEIHYPAAECTRLYAIQSAPLRRVIFKVKDEVESRQGEKLRVQSVANSGGTLVYACHDAHEREVLLHEKDLKDSMVFTSPENRFSAKLFDDIRDFTLRRQAVYFQHEVRKSPLRGFLGGRIDLIPHQLYIAREVSGRSNPRALLSDETGLGKTVEACLILHRLLLTNQIQRVLILVPESLVHQWFVELLRKFNLIFKIYNEALPKDPEINSPGANMSGPGDSGYTGNIFLEDQLHICSIDILSDNARLQQFALEAKWDMIVVDEAHHLTEASPGYLAVKDLAQKTAGLLLLTATPEQFGFKSHFARLHLLDPARYFDYDRFRKEEEQYLLISGIADKIAGDKPLSETEKNILSSTLPQNTGEMVLPAMDDLLDRFGAGRAVFQNTRSIMKGFPERRANLVVLKPEEKDLALQTLEFHLKDQKDLSENDSTRAESNQTRLNFSRDKRIEWLITLIKDPRKLKILVICRLQEKARAVEESLRRILNIEMVLFHEDLSLLQRDKNAARFAEESGAQVMVCSEIGSEGRNFQFAHHLVLFDLPFNPELLEQRIGRLDRIGQKETIHIHVPCIEGSEYEILARWYHEGLNAFNRNIPGVHVIFEALKEKLGDIILEKDLSSMPALIGETKTLCEQTAEIFKKGKDHLLELNSFRPQVAESIIEKIREAENSRQTEDFMLALFEAYGIDEDFISERTYRLDLSMMTTEEFPLPVLRKDDLIVTFDRKTAVTREHIEFISRDHPIITSSLEYLIGSEKGNCALAILVGQVKQTILLECIYILECVAPAGLRIDRFLAPTPVRVIINHLQKNCEKEYTPDFLQQNLKNASNPGAAKILDNTQFKLDLFPVMQKKCASLAETKGEKIRNRASQKMQKTLQLEIERLRHLQKINPGIQGFELDNRLQEQTLLDNAILHSRLRLDSLQLILSDDLAG